MEKKAAVIRVVELVKTCNACPAQWDGMTDDGRKVYVRYRWGCLSVRLGAVGDHGEWAGVEGDELVSQEIGDSYDGEITLDELKYYTEGVIEWPALDNERQV